MICQVCKQRHATTHLKRVINGKVFEAYVCDHCAVKQGADVVNVSALSLGSLFGGLFSEPVWRGQNNAERCTTCMKSFQEIIDSGRVGCADCYTVFYDRLLPSVQKIHGKTTHIGKSPTKRSEIQEVSIDPLQELRQELQTAVEAQEYERCAELRDRIIQLEGGDDNA